MNHPRIIFTILFLAPIACGPPSAGPDPSEGETGSGESPDTSTNESSEAEAEAEAEAETETETETETGTFVDEGMPGPASCNPWDQDCPQGEKCVPFSRSGGSWDDNKCVPVMGDRAPGEPCTYAGVVEATDDCDQTSMCWNVNDEGVGICHAFCTDIEDPQCPPGFYCAFSGSGVINICLATCNPLAQDCSDDTTCLWTGTNFACVFKLDDIPAGEPCTYINDCALGLVCLDASVFPNCEGVACCTPYCNIELGDAQCEGVAGTECVPFFEDGTAPPGNELVGVCVLP